MACRFTYQGKTYDQDGLVEALAKMPLADAAKHIPGVKALPEMPFSKSWPELALKRMVRWASDNGYDALTWTPGHVQAERYDLSKHLNEVVWSKSPKPGADVYSFSAHGKDGRAIMAESGVPLARIEEVLGKDIARNISEGKGSDAINGPHRGRLTGLDLKVGGEGMHGFYDKMLPSIVNKLVKKHGVKVDETEIGKARELPGWLKEDIDNEHVPGPVTVQPARVNATDYRLFAYDGNGADLTGPLSPRFPSAAEAQAWWDRGDPLTVHRLHLPESLKDEARKGFTLFANKGSKEGKALAVAANDNPKFKRWFGKSKVVDEGGNPAVVYHGSVTDFDAFDQQKAGIEADFGKGFYFTNTPDDVSTNYAGMGPDLTNKIERRAEQIDDSGEAETYDQAKEMARAHYVQHEGAVYPVYLSIRTPLEIGGKKETFLDLETPYNEKLNEYGEPEGRLADFIEGLRSAAGKFDGGEVEPAIQKIMEDFSDGAKASDLMELVKADEELGYYIDDNGDMASNEIIRQALEKAGFDGIIDRSVDEKFGSHRRIGKPMSGVTPNTVHYIAFRPNQIKSVANRGTFSTSDPNILYSNPRIRIAPVFANDDKKKRLSGKIVRPKADVVHEWQKAPLDASWRTAPKV